MPTAHAQAGLCAGRSPRRPSRERPRYLRAASASMAAPPRVRQLVRGPRAPALPLGTRTHHKIGAAGGRTALASAPPTPLHHRGRPRLTSASVGGGQRPRRHVTVARPMASPLRGAPGCRLAFRETWRLERDGVRPVTSAFVGCVSGCLLGCVGERLCLVANSCLFTPNFVHMENCT